MSAITLDNLPAVSNGSIDAYLNYVYSLPLLSEEEELNYANRWHNHQDVEAAKHLVLSHLRLVVSISRNYLGYGLPFADIIQEGTIGLMKAVKRFDPSRKVRLVTFAMHWIKAEINDFVMKNWRIVRTVTTKAQRKLFFSLRSNREELGDLSLTEAKQIAAKLDVDVSDVIEMNMRLTGGDVALIGSDEMQNAPIDWLTDSTQTPEETIARKQEYNLQTQGLEHALTQLDTRSRRIIESRWLTDSESQLTLHDLAHELNISAERVRQIETKALQKMRGALGSFIN